MPRLKVGLLVSLALLMFALLIMHAPGLNGPPSYWAWGWRRLPWLAVYGGMTVAAVPFFMGQFLEPRGRIWRVVALLMMMCTSWAMQIVSIAVRESPPRFGAVTKIAFNPAANGYFTDAIRLNNDIPSVREWIDQYPSLMPRLSLHPSTKPPGPLLFWMIFVKRFGPTERAAIAGSLVLAAIATLAIPATYLLLKHLLADVSAAFCGASFLALCPGFNLFVPMFDPSYIILSCMLVGFWSVALRDDDWRSSSLVGVTLAATLFITFNILVIGAIMVALTAFTGNRRRSRKLEIGAKHASISAGTCVLVLIAMRLAIGFHPVQVFFTALSVQHDLLAAHASERPWPQTIPFDLADFALGSGWISFLLAIYFFATRRKETMNDEYPPSPMKVAVLAVGQIVLVALTGLLPLESARVWNFLLPLLMIPVGLELRFWPRRQRLAAYLSLLLVTSAICQNLQFVGDH